MGDHASMRRNNDPELPWTVQDLSDDEDCFPWGIANKWGVIIGRFDTRQQATLVVRAIDAIANVQRFIASQRVQR